MNLLYCYYALLSARRCRWSGRRRGKSGFLLLGQKSELIHTGRANVVDNLHYPAVFSSCIGLEKDPFVGAVRQSVLDLLCQIVWIDGVGPEEDLVIASDRNLQCVFLIG